MCIALVVLLTATIPAPAALAAVALPTLFVVPSCVTFGSTPRIVVLGAGWANGAVTLSRNSGGVTTTLDTVTARTSPANQRPGSFSYTTTIAANAAPLRILATQGSRTQPADVGVTSTGSCPVLISVTPTCLKSPGSAVVRGTGFFAGSEVPIDVDPFGNAEAVTQTTKSDGNGAFTATVNVPFAGGTAPIVATRRDEGLTFAVAFVDPCPTDPTTGTTGPKPNPGTTGTTAPKTGTTATTVVPPVGGSAPAEPPVTVQTPGTPARVTISPRTVRPGRCAVLVISAAPPALPVVARFADGPPVNAQTGPDGGAVVSVCHAQDSGIPLGPVKVLLAIGAVAPVPAFTVLRVPPRPQPPLLQSGADSRRS